MFYPDIQQNAQSQVNSFVRMRTPVGVSGIVEDAERLIAMRKHLDKIQEAVRSYAPTTEEAVIDLGDEFHLWCQNAMEGSKARGGEIFSAMQKAAEQIFKEERKSVPGLAVPEPAKKAASTTTPAIKPATTVAQPAAARPAGDALSLLDQAVRQQKPALAEFNESLLPDIAPPDLVIDHADSAGRTDKQPEPLVHPANISFSMDDHAPDTATQNMIARTAVSAAVMQEVKQMQQNGSDPDWAGTLPEARLAANTAVKNANPEDPQNAYPESPVPKNFSANSLRGALSDLKGKMTDSLKATSPAASEKEEQQ